MNLPIHRRPLSLGGTGKAPVWKLDPKTLPTGLIYVQDKPTHGLILPAYPMPYTDYKALLESTQKLWTFETN